MLGIVFTEFFELVEAQFGDQMLDDIIDDAALENDGAYTAIGQYHHDELLKLVQALSLRVEMPVQALVRSFGQHLFGQFLMRYPIFFTGVESSIGLLTQIENHIHVEVIKLYPQSALPTFKHTLIDQGTLQLEYTSERPFSDLAQGLIEGCADYFGEHLELHRSDNHDDKNYRTLFVLKYG